MEELHHPFLLSALGQDTSAEPGCRDLGNSRARAASPAAGDTCAQSPVPLVTLEWQHLVGEQGDDPEGSWKADGNEQGSTCVQWDRWDPASLPSSVRRTQPGGFQRLWGSLWLPQHVATDGDPTVTVLGGSRASPGTSASAAVPQGPRCALQSGSGSENGAYRKAAEKPRGC